MKDFTQREFMKYADKSPNRTKTHLMNMFESMTEDEEDEFQISVTSLLTVFSAEVERFKEHIDRLDSELESFRVIEKMKNGGSQ